MKFSLFQQLMVNTQRGLTGVNVHWRVAKDHNWDIVLVQIHHHATAVKNVKVIQLSNVIAKLLNVMVCQFSFLSSL